MSNAFVIIKMCYVYNQWYDISCVTLYLVCRACRISADTTGGGSTFSAVSNSVADSTRRTVQELGEECVWLEIPSSYGFNLLFGSRYFAPDTTADTLKRYFGYTQHVLDTHKSRVLLLGDSNIASFVSCGFDRASSIICGNKMPTRCNRWIFIADLIACSTCFGHHYAHHQELESNRTHNPQLHTIPTTWKPSTKYDRQQPLV